MEVTETIVTKSATAAKIELPETTKETKEEVAEYLIEQILLDVAKRRSPVSGETFQPLTSDYRKKKQEEGGQGVPNLELSGDMLDELDYRLTEDGIEIGVFGSSAPKADGHNNLSGDSPLPTRQFIPDVGETFRPAIQNEVERIVADGKAESISESDIEEFADDVRTPSELYDKLGTLLGLTSQTEIRKAVLRSPMLFNWLGLYGLDDFL